ncbi:hypothetical protein K458DRAFT_26708 [Lentithecium fluviatile CBS 122367]|uniref:N-acetyltransferase B complex non catalytic subunit-domain-containing protein n=1 Tax=Lentithecium fluviatile CBS 122367 TaxID=1168545 RepID=A0A6G1J2Z7_9PLEO|nr:hypothetical protein K458DRAFT_26708 [Lentithecium fluviatile CBS 122367]
MAYNWDKLCKAQRDYPKPKYALDTIGKHLKKRPGDPYVLAWKASILLSQDGNTQDILNILTPFATRQPPITDLSLLSYSYKLLLEATRRHDFKTSLYLGTVGELGLKIWQNAAKMLSNRTARLELWSELFVAAMRQDCWEDVRFAIVQANKESPASKKTAYYSFILANQLAAEHKIKIGGAGAIPDMSYKIQLGVAHQKMKDAFEGSPRLPDQAVRVSDMRDLRFMTFIYSRQNRIDELFDAWSKPPPVLKKLFDDHRMDILISLVKVAHGAGNWATAAGMCVQIVQKELEPDGNIAHVCSTAWSIWSTLLEAMPLVYPQHEVMRRYAAIYESFQKKTLNTGIQTRAIQLTRLTLSVYAGQSSLPLAKTFWLDNFSRRTCFFDLRRVVALMSTEHMKEFHSFISANARARIPDMPSEISTREWLLAEASVLQFEYLMFVSIPENPEVELIEAHATASLKLYHIATQVQDEVACDIAIVAVMSLLRLHLLNMEKPFSTPPQLQAAMLLRHLLSDETFRNARQLALLSTRVHLNLGLGTIAFEHYGYAKVKEMLNDTTSWVLLSRISQAHPFDVKGPRGFSADEELAKVIGTIDKMEGQLGDFLYRDLQDFSYDTAFDLLDLKRQERSSLTKHACMIERRRIARLKDYVDMSANYDFSALPNFDFVEKQNSQRIFIEHPPVTALWVANYRSHHDLISRLIFKEPVPFAFRKTMDNLLIQEMSDQDGTGRTPEGRRRQCQSRTEQRYEKLFEFLATIAAEVYDLQPRFSENPVSIASAFIKLNFQLEDCYETYRFFIDDAHSEEPVSRRLCSEHDLMHSYGLLEILVLVARFIPTLRGIARDKSHKLYLVISKANVDRLLEKARDCYNIVRTVAEKDIDRMKKTGMSRLRKEVRERSTGQALRAILSDKDVETYAKGYVESAIEAFSGILKVKLE